MNLAILPRLRHRVMITSIAIIALITSALAWVINELYSQSYMAAYSTDLVAQMPLVVAQLNRAGLIKDVDKWIDSLDPSATDYMSVLCDLNDNTMWLSNEAKAAGLTGICSSLPDSMQTPTLVKADNTKSYIAYDISRDRENGNAYQLVVLRSGTAYEQSLKRLHNRTALYLGLFVLIAVAFLIAAFHWSFQPLRKLATQLNQVTDAKREQLDSDFPTELQDVTQSLNRLIRISNDKTARYRHAMDDLAHSLKTRLAAANALLDDHSLPRCDLNHRMLEQISQMDDLVQYQLKRALMGQQGLQKDKTLLNPVVESFERMLKKIYSTKQVTLKRQYSTALNLPLNRTDLMELLGNLLENAFRFCISEIRLSAARQQGKLVIRIEDDGPGVSDDMREAIFQRGIRADQRNPGQGIGLSVCHDIVSCYGGRIYVEKASIEGAAFVIELPDDKNN